ncbi:derlin-1 isoform X2 [Lycium barbarum]|uniref:derlin-1 isoform X2 n=1 Tax=Lycium barbarum TaxID=112863 RepID=UPI00293F1328|nr:derlin-1 isoform X2 [Lycium barbarum]
MIIRLRLKHNEQVVVASKRSVIKVWRLIANFFFLGKFSINFGIRLLMIARYGVQLESGPFQRRTADFLWMMIFGALTLLALSAIPFFWSPFLGISLVFMLLYVWSREFPTANINIYGLVTLKAFYLPWAMLGLDVIFGSPILPDLLGIIAGHLYYFLTVLHPLATGKNLLKTPMWVHKLVMRWRIGAPAATPAQPDNSGATFRGRSYRVGGATAYPAQPDRGSGVATTNPVQPDNGSGVAFRGRSYRLGG